MYQMAEELGGSFGHTQVSGMTVLNRMIVDRLKKARDIVFDSQNTCTDMEVHDLRIIVKETVSYMTAVLIQGLIDSMLGELDCCKALFLGLVLHFTYSLYLPSCLFRGCRHQGKTGGS